MVAPSGGNSHSRWKIFYDDGSTYSNNDGPPERAPGTGVQIIVSCDDRLGRTVLCGGQPFRDDYFWWNPEDVLWERGDFYGMLDQLSQPGWKKVLFGRTMSNPKFQAIYKRAVMDQEFPPKSGWMPGERPVWLTWEDRES